MTATRYPAFEAAMATDDKETMLALYDLEHTLRVRAEMEKQALLWAAGGHSTTSKAAEPGYLATGRSFPPATEEYTLKDIKSKPRPKQQSHTTPADTPFSHEDIPV